MATSTPRRVEELGGTMWLIMANSCRELWLQNRYDRGNPAENSQQVCFVTRFWVIVLCIAQQLLVRSLVYLMMWKTICFR